MKLFFASFLLISIHSFADGGGGGPYGNCQGGLYWDLMDKSETICRQHQELFAQQNGLSCKIKYHNGPNVCWSYCTDANNKLAAKLRVDMYSNCDYGTVNFKKTKITWYH